MASDVARMILGMAKDIEAKECQETEMVIEVTHGFLDEYELSQWIKMKRSPTDGAIIIQQRWMEFAFGFGDLTDDSIDIIFQEILMTFLDILFLEDGVTSYNKDADHIKISIFKNGSRLASGSYFFIETIFEWEVRSCQDWFTNDKCSALRVAFRRYMRHGLCLLNASGASGAGRDKDATGGSS